MNLFDSMAAASTDGDNLRSEGLHGVFIFKISIDTRGSSRQSGKDKDFVDDSPTIVVRGCSRMLIAIPPAPGSEYSMIARNSHSFHTVPDQTTASPFWANAPTESI
jgi:hypothetical protein